MKRTNPFSLTAILSLCLVVVALSGCDSGVTPDAPAAETVANEVSGADIDAKLSAMAERATEQPLVQSLNFDDVPGTTQSYNFEIGLSEGTDFDGDFSTVVAEGSLELTFADAVSSTGTVPVRAILNIDGRVIGLSGSLNTPIGTPFDGFLRLDASDGLTTIGGILDPEAGTFAGFVVGLNVGGIGGFNEFRATLQEGDDTPGFGELEPLLGTTQDYDLQARTFFGDPVEATLTLTISEVEITTPDGTINGQPDDRPLASVSVGGEVGFSDGSATPVEGRLSGLVESVEEDLRNFTFSLRTPDNRTIRLFGAFSPSVGGFTAAGLVQNDVVQNATIVPQVGNGSTFEAQLLP